MKKNSTRTHKASNLAESGEQRAANVEQTVADLISRVDALDAELAADRHEAPPGPIGLVPAPRETPGLGEWTCDGVVLRGDDAKIAGMLYEIEGLVESTRKHLDVIVSLAVSIDGEHTAGEVQGTDPDVRREMAIATGYAHGGLRAMLVERENVLDVLKSRVMSERRKAAG